jgi:CheY-like chemotaxis protein
MADQLGSRQHNNVIERDMNKAVEVDFLPRETDVDFTSSNLAPSLREKPRILVVDNDRNTTHLVKVLLERTGSYLVFEENDPIEAHRTARNFRPDLILIDVVMPIRDGGEIAMQIRADPELQNTPIIFLTALVTRAESKSGLHIDGHPVLAKPIDVQELIKTIEGHLAEHAKVAG